MHFFYDKLLTYRIVALLSPGCLLGLFLLSVVLQNTHTRSRHTRSFAAHALLACVPEYENRATYFKRQAKYDTREFRSHFGRPYLSIGARLFENKGHKSEEDKTRLVKNRSFPSPSQVQSREKNRVPIFHVAYGNAFTYRFAVTTFRIRAKVSRHSRH